jgi:hypothetical protein
MSSDGETPIGTLGLGMYALHLGSGNSLLCKSLTSDTIIKYVRNVAEFLLKFSHNGRDYRFLRPNDKLYHPLLSKVFSSLRKWDEMPNRREPFTLELLSHIQKTNKANKEGFASLASSLADWFEIGLFAGNRLSEWAQPCGRSDPDNPQTHESGKYDGDTVAFCIGDMRAQSANGTLIGGADILSFPVEQIAKIWCCWRTQKNKDNGEEKLWALPASATARSFIRPMYRIIQRFVHFRGLTDDTTPLSIYQHKDASIRLINDHNIERSMRELAAQVYNLDPTKEKDRRALQRWSAHSLRVGACTLLHSMGFSPPQIKFILRWRSDAYLLYLRNNVILSQAQNAAFDKADSMPNFL